MARSNFHQLWDAARFAFRRTDLTGWVSGMFWALVTEPMVYVPELVGLSVLVWFIWSLVRRKTFYAFFRRGQVEQHSGIRTTGILRS